MVDGVESLGEVKHHRNCMSTTVDGDFRAEAGPVAAVDGGEAHPSTDAVVMPTRTFPSLG